MRRLAFTSPSIHMLQAYLQKSVVLIMLKLLSREGKCTTSLKLTKVGVSKVARGYPFYSMWAVSENIRNTTPFRGKCDFRFIE